MLVIPFARSRTWRNGGGCSRAVFTIPKHSGASNFISCIIQAASQNVFQIKDFLSRHSFSPYTFWLHLCLANLPFFALPFLKACHWAFI